MTISDKPVVLASTIGLLILGGVAATAFAVSPPDSKEAQQSTRSANEPSVMAFDQKIQGNEVRLDYVYLPTNGYAVIYGAGKDGARTGEPIGHVELKAGDHRGVKVKLASAPAAGTQLWASLYEDADKKQGFDRGADKPIWAKELPAENRFIVQ